MAALLLVPAAALAALFVSVWPWTALYDERPTVRLLAALILVSSLEVGLQIALGALGILTPVSLLALTGVVTLASVLIWSLRSDCRQGWWPRLEPPSVPGSLLGAVALVTWAGLTWVATLVPPYGWDTLVYHLTAVFYLAQTGGLEPFPYPAFQFSFPLVGELHQSWFFLLSGAGPQSWRVTGIALAPLALTAGVAMRATIEALDLDRARTWILPATMVTPLLLVQAVAGYIDGAFAAFVLGALAFAVLAVRDQRPAHLAFVALASGLALGTKLSFIYLGAPVVLVLASPHLWRRFASRRLVLRVAILAALLGVGCGFWLIRNVARHGNPLYPLELAIGGTTLLPGPVTLEPETDERERYAVSIGGWLAYPFGETFKGRVQYTVDNGFGPLFAAGLVLTPFALLAAVRRRQWLLARALASLPLLLTLWLAVSPWEHPRYALPACGLALLSLATVCDDLRRHPRRCAQTAIVAAVLFSAAAGLASSAQGLPDVVARWHAGSWTPTDYYRFHYGAAAEAFSWLEARPKPGTTISFDQGIFVAPLFGWHGRNRVVYAASPRDPAIGSAPYVSTSEEWRSYLGEQGVEWFVVWKDWWLDQPPASLPARWLDDTPRGFQLAAEFGRHASIYRREPDPALAETRPPDPDRSLDELTTADRWVTEYRAGADARLATDPAGGLRIDYRFESSANDYLDLRFDLTESGWPSSAELAFDLEADETPTLLFVYLKESDPRRACRFRVDLSSAPASGRVRLDLRSPEWTDRTFRSERIVELHLVLDDKFDEQSLDGTLRISNFSLQPREETT